MDTIDNNTFGFCLSKLKNFDKPIILELGVDKGGSTAKFLKFINDNGGELYSIDIKDCSNVVNNENFKNVDTKKWNFLKTNDLNIEHIFEKFPKIKDGVDVLYIDSYHDETHVKKTLEKWFIYVKKNGYIFFDDTESLFYKKLKNFSLSVNNDAIDKFVKKFFYNNSHQISYTKYFKGSGLSEFNKLSKLGSKPIFTNNVWEYNFIIARIYLTVKKILYIVKSKDKKDSNIQ